jgi:glycine/D-amino acid oxidase-like deaminating enzyme
MQSPSVGQAVAAELLGETSKLDLAPYRLERFASDAVFPEEVVL